MKKLIGILLITFLLMSCATINDFKSIQSVKKEFPGAIDIRKSIECPSIFVVMDIDSSLWYVNTQKTLEKKLLLSLKK